MEEISNDRLNEFIHQKSIKVYDETKQFYVEYTLKSNHQEDLDLNYNLLSNSRIEISNSYNKDFEVNTDAETQVPITNAPEFDPLSIDHSFDDVEYYYIPFGTRIPLLYI